LADPDYAPAWDELGWRYYLDAAYSDGGEKAYGKSVEASARAASLVPNGTDNWNTVRVEHGQLQEGYDEALRLLSRRPDTAAAHFEMAYVYRYSGLLDQSARECDAALAIDPGDFLLRSCAKVFMHKGDYARAQSFVDLDGSSGWSVRQRMHFALRQHNYPLALGTLAVASGYKDSEIVVAKLEHKSPEVLDSLGAREETSAATQSDPEEKYEVAAMLSFADQTTRAIRVLRTAIDNNYCANPLLDVDPLLANLRARPDFRELNARAASCQRSFLDHLRTQVPSSIASSR
jgi:tetratricopeptide (TPR) repeat protein